MEIESGGAIESLKFVEGKKIETVTFAKADSTRYTFEMWINGDCLSYLSLDEMLRMRDEINKAILKSVNCT